MAPNPRRSPLVPGLLAASLALLTACEKPWSPPDVVLISVDTLRADHLPTYGYERETAPRIDALARQSAVFDRAYAHSHHTLPSHTSLLTGIYPGRHGVLHRGDALAEGDTTWAELLAANGYATAAVVNAYFLAPEFQVDRGFAHYDYAHNIEVDRNAETANTAIFSWLDELSADSPDPRPPFFLFAHYYDVHSDWGGLPYEAPAELKRRFAGEAPKTFRSGDGKRFASRYMAWLNQHGSHYTPEDLEYIRGLYDAGIAYTDTRVGALLDALAGRGLLERAIVILTSDHGEEFQDHGKLLHAQLYDELVRVPLLFSLPEMRGDAAAACRTWTGPRATPGRVDALVQHVDMLPTVAECLGLESPAGVQGRSVLATLVGGESGRDTAWFDTPKGHSRAVMRDGWKLIDWPTRDVRRLYDLRSDPGETRDVAAEHPERVAALMEALDRHDAENRAGRNERAAADVPDEVHRKLEALGYVQEQEPDGD